MKNLNNEQIQRRRNPYKALWYILFIFLILLVTQISIVSALEFDNTVTFHKDVGKYGKYEIRDWFGLQKLTDIELKNNTFDCIDNCSAEKEFVMYQKGELISDVRFYTISDWGNASTTIKSYQFYIKEGASWIPYNLGEEVEVGTYLVRLEGTKDKSKIVDWQIESQGVWTEEWIEWGVAPVTDAHGQALSSAGTDSPGAGGKIVTNSAVKFTNVTKKTEVDADTACLLTFSEAVLECSTFTGNVANFDTDLTNDTIYIVTINESGGNYDQYRTASLTGTFNISDTNVDWIAGYLSGQPNNGQFDRIYNFESITTERPGGSVTLNSPVDNFNSSLNEVEFNCSTSISGSTLTNISLWHNESGTFEFNQSTDITGTSNETTFNSTFAEGSYSWGCQACAVDGTCGFASANRTLTIDTTAPVIDILAPVGILSTNSVGNPENLNWTVTDDNLNSCWFDYNGTNQTVVCGDNNITFILEDNNLNLTFYANDSTNNVASNFTSWEYAFLQGDSVFNSTTFETSIESFITNITTLSDIITINPILNYNGTRTLGTASCIGTTCTLTATIDINLVGSGFEVENKTWLWEVNGFTTDASFSFNSTEQLQNVTRIHLEECDGTFTDLSLNFTAFNEANLTAISPFTFDGTFEIWVGNGNIRRSNNFTNSSIPSFPLCIEPTTIDLRTAATIEYDEAGESNYTKRNYYFDNDTINSTDQNIALGLLFAEDSTSFILKAQDTDLLPVADVLIFTERFYPGTDSFEVVQVAKTDDSGQTIGFFKTETVDYRFILKINGTTVLTTGIQKIIPTSAPFTLTFTIGEDAGSAWEGFEDLEDLTFVNDFNKTSSVYTFTYTDTSGNFDSAALEVYLLNGTGDDPLLCNDTISQSSASLTCNLTGNGTGQYTAKGIIFRSSVRNLVFQENFNIEDFSGIAGDLGLFLGWFIILIASFAFSFNEIAGIFMVNIAMIFVNAIGLIAFGPVFIGAMIAISILIGVILER